MDESRRRGEDGGMPDREFDEWSSDFFEWKKRIDYPGSDHDWYALEEVSPSFKIQKGRLERIKEWQRMWDEIKEILGDVKLTYPNYMADLSTIRTFFLLMKETPSNYTVYAPSQIQETRDKIKNEISDKFAEIKQKAKEIIDTERAFIKAQAERERVGGYKYPGLEKDVAEYDKILDFYMRGDARGTIDGLVASLNRIQSNNGAWREIEDTVRGQTEAIAAKDKSGGIKRIGKIAKKSDDFEEARAQAAEVIEAQKRQIDGQMAAGRLAVQPEQAGALSHADDREGGLAVVEDKDSEEEK